MHHPYRNLWILFAVQAIVVLSILASIGRLVAVPQFDTTSYTDYSAKSLPEVLIHKRTFVYPLLLQCFQPWDANFRFVPMVQFGSAVFAAGTFLWVTLRCGWHPAIAWAASSPLLCGQLVTEYTHILTPDLLAQSWSILAIACWIRSVHRGGSRASSIGIAITSFLAYQTKPACLFLLVFLPIGGVIARWWLYNSERDAWRVGLRLTTAAWSPFLLWCLMRWWVVGHFGLVSFGGYNVVGIAGHFLDDQLVQELSTEVRPLGQSILDRRRTRPDLKVQIDYPTIEAQFNGMVWEVAVPAADSLFQSDSARMNQGLTQLSKEIIARRPARYLQWLLAAIKHSVSETLHLTLTHPAVLIALIVAIVAHGRMGWPRSQMGSVPVRRPSPRLISHEFQWMVWLALGYALCSLTLVILVEPPISRYVAPGIVFIPSIVAMLVAAYWIHFPSDRANSGNVD